MSLSGPLRALGRWSRELWGRFRPSADAREIGWTEAVRSACETLVTSRGVIDTIDLKGDRWARANPDRLHHLTELAQRIATEYGVQVQVSYDDSPVVRLVAGGDKSSLPVTRDAD